MLKLLLAHGCTVGAAAGDDMNALHFAAQKGHSECVRHLLNAGQYMDARTRKGFTPLHFAAQGGGRAGRGHHGRDGGGRDGGGRTGVAGAAGATGAGVMGAGRSGDGRWSGATAQ